MIQGRRLGDGYGAGPCTFEFASLNVKLYGVKKCSSDMICALIRCFF